MRAHNAPAARNGRPRAAPQSGGGATPGAATGFHSPRAPARLRRDRLIEVKGRTTTLLAPELLELRAQG
ncbi:hypothetical protein [Streptomyces sp. 891-h]|uniref:hypothetical protein n=1 Tax=Streptomyces sp. 891-h TaxID=2720714 RepID=UPI001FA98E19|nr:hypothetical protein [Streptomyces sp. 891-h]UNZ20839.1 hypothetical protein HC362_30950 [Streptomyces sp. 891-h]